MTIGVSNPNISNMYNFRNMNKFKVLATAVIIFLVSENFLFAQQLEFQHKIISPKSSSQARQIGDFNNDGKKDILVIEGEFKPTQFAWYEYPTWKKHDINNAELANLFYVADCNVVDVDNDGDMDIIFPDAHEKSMRVLWFENPLPKGKTDDAWTKHVIADFGDISWLKDIEVADFNKDGKLDAAVRGEDLMHVSYQKENNEWETVNFPIKKHEGLASGDIDRDGYPDLISNGFWLKNPGKSIHDKWSEYVFDAKWFDQNTDSWMDNNVQVRVGDINSDGLLDIIISNSEKPEYPVAWYIAPGDPINGTWREQKIGVMDYCHTLQLGDFDNDGDIDVLAAEMKKEKSAGRMILFINEGAPKTPESWKDKSITWKEQLISTSGAYWAIAGDLGSDGDVDILSSGRYDLPPIEIWENKLNDKKLSLDKWTYIEVDNDRKGFGDFEGPGWEWLKYFGIAAGDVSNDGNADIVSGRYCYINPGGNMTSKWERIDLGKNVDANLMLDVDGDENADIIALALPNVYWLEAVNGGKKWTITQVAQIPPPGHHNSQGSALAQIISGGKQEILLESGEGVYNLEIPANPESGNWPKTRLTGNGTHAEGIGTGDIDGDGYVDLATGKGWKGVVWWKNPGDASGDWTQYEVGRIKTDYVDKLAIADVNGDGRNDIIAAEELYPDIFPAQLYWFEQPENPTEEPALFNWKRHEISGQKFTLNNMNIADMDHDGDIDVVSAEHKGDQRTFVYENDGKGNFTEHIVAKNKEGHGGAFIFDMDGDGDFDIMNIAWENFKYLHLFRNDAIKKDSKK